MTDTAARTLVPQLISERELAERTNISRGTLGYLRRTQGLPYIRVSEKVVRYCPAEVAAWFCARHEGGTAAGEAESAGDSTPAARAMRIVAGGKAT